MDQFMVKIDRLPSFHSESSIGEILNKAVVCAHLFWLDIGRQCDLSYMSQASPYWCRFEFAGSSRLNSWSQANFQLVKLNAVRSRKARNVFRDRKSTRLNSSHI